MSRTFTSRLDYGAAGATFSNGAGTAWAAAGASYKPPATQNDDQRRIFLAA